MKPTTEYFLPRADGSLEPVDLAGEPSLDDRRAGRVPAGLVRRQVYPGFAPGMADKVMWSVFRPDLDPDVYFPFEPKE